MAFPSRHRTKLHSTNPLERLNKEVKRRADVVGIFPNEASITRLVGAVLLEQNDDWQLQHRYMQIEGMAELDAETTPEISRAPPHHRSHRPLHPKTPEPMNPEPHRNYTSLTDVIVPGVAAREGAVGVDAAGNTFAEARPGGGSKLAMAVAVLNVGSCSLVGDGSARHGGPSVWRQRSRPYRARSDQHPATAPE
jgi:hypothetical protein